MTYTPILHSVLYTGYLYSKRQGVAYLPSVLGSEEGVGAADLLTQLLFGRQEQQ